MATPIALERPRRDPREELQTRLEQAPAEHAEALLAALDVLQGLNDRGVLELLRGALGSSDRVLEIAVEAVSAPDTIKAVRNLLLLVQILATIEPDLLTGIARSVPEALAAAAKAQEAEPPGFWETLRILRSKNLRRGLALANSVLDTWSKKAPVRR